MSNDVPRQKKKREGFLFIVQDKLVYK